MKRIAWWLLVFMLWTAKDMAAQDPNPQTSYAATVLYAQPSFYLNFNDASTSFLDQISGLTFTNTATVTSGGLVNVGSISTPTGNAGTGAVLVNNTAMPAGTLHSCSIQYFAAPTSTPTINCLQVRVTGAVASIIASWAVTPALTTAVQTFAAPGGLTVLAGDMIGIYSDSAPNIGQDGQPDSGSYFITSTQPTGTFTLTSYSPGFAVSAVVDTTVSTTYTSGTVTPRQAGFDNTQVNNTSAEFPYNGFNLAPNNTLGAVEWNAPWTMMVQVDRLNWNRTGTLVLASKGDLAAATYWKLYLQMDGTYSRLCFQMSGAQSSGAPFSVANQSVCTGAGFDAMPNGFNYNIAITNNGSGWATGLTLYLNGLDGTYIPLVYGSNSFQFGFGTVGAALGGSGTGYANSTVITNSGTGGTFCVVNATMNSSSGVPAAIVYTQSSGCTSIPTLSFVSPTGTGATITPTLYTASMNSTTLPLMVPGYVSSTAYNGIDETDSTQTSTYVDEFAIFPSMLSQTATQDIFYHTTFYQIPINTAPANRVAFTFDDDGCGDSDNAFALQAAISAQRYGYLKIEGIISSQVDDDASPFIFRQMLDQAGLSNIPVGVVSSGTPNYSGWCSAANITTYNASTPQVFTAYPSAASVYRQVMADNPTTPVLMFSAGSLTAISEFMQSSADSISSLTGMQLWNRNATNGGAVYLQGGPTCNAPTYCTTTSTATGDNVLLDPVAGQYVLANHGSMPMVMLGGTPASSGPGPLYTRTSKDPMFLAMATYGTDVRAGWDSLPMSKFISSLFWGGVYVTYSGGTGYANSTPFTLSGGGSTCAGSGVMTASGGVPNGITYRWGASAQLYQGLGSGCTSTPTVNLVGAIGTGVALTAYPTSVCVTNRVTQPGGVWTDGVNSTTCDNQYVEPFSQWAAQPGTGSSFPIYTGFLNSLIDPPPNGAPKVP